MTRASALQNSTVNGALYNLPLPFGLQCFAISRLALSALEVLA